MHDKPHKASPMKSLNRRNFLKTTGAAIILPTILPSSVFGRDGKAPSGKINMGVVGWGMQGPGDARSFLSEDDCRVVAVCDLDKTRVQHAKDTVDENYGNKDCVAYHDYREMFARPDLDAVLLAVPDHWHALVSTEAARRGL